MGVDVKVDGVMVVTGIAVIAAIYLAARKDALVAAVNPADDRNLANRAVNAIGEGISGQDGWTLGGWLYDVLHPYEDDPTRAWYEVWQ